MVASNSLAWILAKPEVKARTSWLSVHNLKYKSAWFSYVNRGSVDDHWQATATEGLLMGGP